MGMQGFRWKTFSNSQKNGPDFKRGIEGGLKTKVYSI
jgi:hypothetical protein